MIEDLPLSPMIEILIERMDGFESALSKVRARLDALEKANNPNPHFKEPTLVEVWSYVIAPPRKWLDFPVERFFNYWRDQQHWVDTKGKPVKDWKARARTFYLNRRDHGYR